MTIPEAALQRNIIDIQAWMQKQTTTQNYLPLSSLEWKMEGKWNKQQQKQQQQHKQTKNTTP